MAFFLKFSSRVAIAALEAEIEEMRAQMESNQSKLEEARIKLEKRKAKLQKKKRRVAGAVVTLLLYQISNSFPYTNC